MAGDPIPRRDFLVGVGFAGTAAAAGVAASSQATAQTPAPNQASAAPAAAAAANAEPEPISCSPDRAGLLVAAADTIIPADELSPSGTDCGVATFIDRQLASAWGGGAKMYRSGPLHEGQAGARLSARAHAEANSSSAGIAAANEWSRRPTARTSIGSRPPTASRRFPRWRKAKPTSRISPRAPSSASFSPSPWQGFFSDPIYGGNRNKVSWQMLGYPGLPATYADKVDAFATSATSLRRSRSRTFLKAGRASWSRD